MALEPISKSLGNYQAATKTPTNTTNESPPNERPRRDGNSLGGPTWANADCYECRGAGWVHPVFPDGKPDYKHVEQCQTCRTYSDPRYRLSDEPLIEAGINPAKSFGFFQTNDANRETYGAAYNFAADPDKLPFLIIQGGTGNGKTHLCHAMAITLHRRGVYFRCLPVAEMLEELKRRIPTNNSDAYLSGLKKIKVLILDDVWEAHLKSDWLVEILQTLVDYRYRETERGYPLPTVLTTNLPLTTLPARIVSRFSEQGMGRKVLNKDIDRRVKPMAPAINS